jgi:hypothetical protein
LIEFAASFNKHTRFYLFRFGIWPTTINRHENPLIKKTINDGAANDFTWGFRIM